MKVLIIDDSVLIRRIIKQVIEENAETEPTVFDASNGQEALEALEKNDIDIIFVDWNMPVLDGLEFVKAVRDKDEQTPIVMISAFTDEDKIYTAAKAGVNTYIEKPIRGTELWEDIKQFFS